MPPILAYFITWTTYGTWLPGDKRGWVSNKDGAWHVEYREGDASLENFSRSGMKHRPVIFDMTMRKLVDATIRKSCKAKGWKLHTINVRSNHIHIVVSTDDVAPEKVMSFLKAWASRKLNESFQSNEGRWWTRHGSTRYITNSKSLIAAVRYVENQ